MLSKPAAESSGGSSAVDVDVERQQIADRVGVLGAVQAMQRRRAGIGAPRRGAIEPRFERGGEGVERGAVGRGAPLGGIMPVLSLRRPFPRSRRGRRRCVEVAGCRARAAGLGALVVAGDAVLLEERRRSGGACAGARVVRRTGRLASRPRDTDAAVTTNATTAVSSVRSVSALVVIGATRPAALDQRDRRRLGDRRVAWRGRRLRPTSAACGLPCP